MKPTLLIGLMIFSMFSTRFALSDDASPIDSDGFVGHWVLKGGEIQAKSLGMPSGEPLPCSLIDMHISLTPQTLTIDSYHAVCGSINSKWGPYPMELRGQTVYTDGAVAGTFDGQKLDVRLTGGYYLKFELKPGVNAGDPPILDTLYGVTNIVNSLEISGALPQN